MTLLASPDVTASSHDVINDLARDLRHDAMRAALLFDIDGVLAPIVARADNARVPDEVIALLGELRDRYLVVGIVSGRGLADVDRMVPVPGLTRGGNHGLEVARPGGAPEIVAEAVPHAAAMRAFVTAYPDAVLRPRGVWMEDKGVSVSLHFREAPDPTAAEAFLASEVSAAALAAGLRLRPGRMILEVLPDVDVDKGTVVREIIRTSGAQVAMYVGDDQTDMHAWRALHDLQGAGALDRALCVVADQPGVDPNVRGGADIAIGGTDGVLALLRALAT